MIHPKSTKFEIWPVLLAVGPIAACAAFYMSVAYSSSASNFRCNAAPLIHFRFCCLILCRALGPCSTQTNSNELKLKKKDTVVCVCSVAHRSSFIGSDLYPPGIEGHRGKILEAACRHCSLQGIITLRLRFNPGSSPLRLTFTRRSSRGNHLIVATRTLACLGERCG